MLILIFGELVLAVYRVTQPTGLTLAMATTGVSVVATWVGVRRYDDNAAAYSVAAHELGAIKSEIASIPDDETSWSEFVNDAEAAISREHTTWKASRQR